MESLILSSVSESSEQHTSEISSINLSTKSTKHGAIEKYEDSCKSDNSKSYKAKISNHFKHIKEKTIRNLKKEDTIFFNKADSVKYICKTRENPYAENVKFFFGINKSAEEVQNSEEGSGSPLEDNKTLVSYALPHLETFNLKISEKDSITTFKGRSLNSQQTKNANRKYLDEGLYINHNQRIKRRDINIIEQRLFEDQKWFNTYGDLKLSQYPLHKTSLRPDKVEKAATENKLPVTCEKCEEIVVIKDNILEMCLTELKFVHHPLFSLEHVLAEKLRNLYDQYTHYVKNNNMNRIKIQLEALRYLKKSIGTRNSRSVKQIDVSKDVQKMRNTYFEEGKRERNTLKDILNTWKEIKKVRAKQNYSNTDIKLHIKKEKVDQEADNLKFERLFQETLQEVIKEARIDLQQKSKVALKDEDKICSADSEEDSTKAENVIDEEHIRKKLLKLFQQSFRSPGEPILKLSLSKDHEISKEIEDEKEIIRRNAVKSTKLHLNILCDKIVVCKSKPLILNDNFYIEINETFAIQLQKVPKYLNIEVIEQPKGLIKNKICDIIVTLPNQNLSYEKNKITTTTFEANKIIHYKHTGVGSGISLKQIAENLTTLQDIDRNLTTSGFIKYYIGWEKTSTVEKNHLEEQINLLKEITDKNLALNVSKLSEWMTHVEPDPQDPGNVAFFEYMASYEPNLFKNNKNFRLSPHIKGLKFCNPFEIEENVRFKILQLRNQNEIEFDGVVVPNRIKEINALDNIKQKKSEENQRYFKDDDGDEMGERRTRGKKYLREIHTKLFQKCKNSENNIVYESVVDEKYLAHFHVLVKTLLTNIFHWFYWQPNKHLITKSIIPYEKKPQDHKLMTKQHNITIKVISGKNIPNRVKYASDELTESGHVETEVKPFVEVSFENLSTRTSSSKGENPTWNETLILPLEYKSMDYMNLDSLNGTIVVNLYDEYDCALKYQNKSRSHWLGKIEIPLSTVCYSTSMTGIFKIKLAELLLGYEKETEKHISKSPKITNIQSYSHHTYIQMEINIVPNVPTLVINTEDLPSGEIPYIQEHIIKWNQNYNSNFPNRKFSALAIDTNAKTVCITRYLKPLEPPQIHLEEFDVTAEQCLRYVSLIPYMDCNQLYQNVWLSTNQLLNFMVGSVTDHAVALTCFLLALKMDVWLLLGYGIPHGTTAYVLTREYVKDSELPTYYIYDTFYNEKYNILDSYNPLQKIYCLANGINVWANMQRTDNINITRFDLNRKSDWLPLFNNDISAPMHSVNNSINYNFKNDTELIEDKIEVLIKKKISKLRQLDRTIWNHDLASDLKNVLRSFEISYMYNKNHFEIVNELNEKFTSYKITGYVLNLAFSNTSTIIKNIKKLGIHHQQNNSEFVLAVYVHIYPGGVVSVWIFIGVAIKKFETEFGVMR